MTSRCVVIEFVGLPGAGKSTLSHRVAEILQGHGVRVEQPVYVVDHEMQEWERYLVKVWRVSAELVLHPVNAVRGANAILSTRQASALDLVGVTANWLFMSSLLRKAERREGLHIFDEGLINALWSIGFSARTAGTTRILGKLARQRSTPVVAVLVEADIPTLRKRVNERHNGQSRLEHPVDADEAWERAQRAFEEIKDTIRVLANEGPGVRVIAVRSRGPEHLDADARYLAAKIEAIWSCPA